MLDFWQSQPRTIEQTIEKKRALEREVCAAAATRADPASQ
jgi:DNA-binding FadR family transcriptional regulator